jgi:hypothetical protein
VEKTPAPGNRIVVNSDDRLNVNITKEFCETILDTIALWRMDYYHQQEPTYRPISHAYIIRNETGQKMRYWLCKTATPKKSPLQSKHPVSQQIIN